LNGVLDRDLAVGNDLDLDRVDARGRLPSFSIGAASTSTADDTAAPKASKVNCSFMIWGDAVRNMD
jgi:hypothetical protein